MPNEKNEFKDYLPEIDGLRAISILGVLFFHLFPKTFSFGYLGVDLFFVISGYLITSIILRKQKSSNFKLTDFWSRRIVRLFPAILIVSTINLIVAYFVLFPKEIIELARHQIASILFR